jgi:ribosomal subunit interface protein
MLLYVTARQIDLTDAIRAYVEERLVRGAERHGARSGTRMEVQLYDAGHRGVRFGCHVLVHMPENHELNVREESGDLYAAIDLAEKRLVREIVELRERRLTEARHPKKYYAAKVIEGERGEGEDDTSPDAEAEPKER